MTEKEKHIIDKKMLEFQENLISNDNIFDESSLSKLLLEGCEFAYENYQIKDDFYDGYNYQFEVEISTIGLRLMSGLKEIYPNLRKSTLLIDTIFNILKTSKYASGRDGFILVLWQNKLDKEFIFAIQNQTDFWNDSRIAFDIVWGLTKRKIGGFSECVNKVLQNFNDKKVYNELIKQCKKYLDDEIKYKHYRDFLSES